MVSLSRVTDTLAKSCHEGNFVIIGGNFVIIGGRSTLDSSLKQKFSSLAAQESVILTMSCTTSNDNFDKIETFPSQYLQGELTGDWCIQRRTNNLESFFMSW